MIQHIFKARIFNSDIKPYSRYDYMRIMEELNTSEVMVTIEKYFDKRSLKQNAYYWGVVIPYVYNFYKDAYGEKLTKEEIHNYHLSKIAGHKVKMIEVLGEVIISNDGKSTSQMNTREFGDFIEKTHKFWAENDLFIPDPDEDYVTDNIDDNGKEE